MQQMVLTSCLESWLLGCPAHSGPPWALPPGSGVTQSMLGKMSLALLYLFYCLQSLLAVLHILSE